jgi:hypothetical protein
VRSTLEMRGKPVHLGRWFWNTRGEVSRHFVGALHSHPKNQGIVSSENIYEIPATFDRSRFEGLMHGDDLRTFIAKIALPRPQNDILRRSDILWTGNRSFNEPSRLLKYIPEPPGIPPGRRVVGHKDKDSACRKFCESILHPPPLPTGQGSSV